MRRNKKKTVTTFEFTWETESRLFVRREIVRSDLDGNNEDTQHEQPRQRILDIAARFLRGKDDEK